MYLRYGDKLICGKADRIRKARYVTKDGVSVISATEGKIERGHAKVILGLSDKAKQTEAANIVAERGLNVRQTEELVRRMNKSSLRAPEAASEVIEVDYIAALERDLTKSLGRKVKLNHGKKRGKLEIEYYGNDDLDILIKALSKIK